MDTATTGTRCSPVSVLKQIAFEAWFEKDCYLVEVVDCNIGPSMAHKTPKEPTTKCWGTQTMFASRLWTSQKKGLPESININAAPIKNINLLVVKLLPLLYVAIVVFSNLWIPGKASQTDAPWPPEPSFPKVLMVSSSAMP